MTSTNLTAKDGKARTTRTAFSRETAVNIDIGSAQSIVWRLLTNAADYPRWNGTVISIEGQIVKGAKIQLKSRLDPKRTFKLKVKSFEPEHALSWGDAMGTRTYTLTRLPGGDTRFSMREKIGGPLFPLFAKMIPSFDVSFEQFAMDLKREAEIIMNTK